MNTFESYYILFYLVLFILSYITNDVKIIILFAIINIVVFIDMLNFTTTTISDYTIYAMFLGVNMQMLFKKLEG